MLRFHTDEDGFGWPITVVDPSDTSVDFIGFANDIGESLDPETGLLVSSRSASVSLPIVSLFDAGMTIPEGIHDSSQRPWVVITDDINGTTHTFKVSATKYDRALGNIVCQLEVYSGYTDTD
jgi:hypothetical protein